MGFWLRFGESGWSVACRWDSWTAWWMGTPRLIGSGCQVAPDSRPGKRRICLNSRVDLLGAGPGIVLFLVSFVSPAWLGFSSTRSVDYTD